MRGPSLTASRSPPVDLLLSQKHYVRAAADSCLLNRMRLVTPAADLIECCQNLVHWAEQLAVAVGRTHQKDPGRMGPRRTGL